MAQTEDTELRDLVIEALEKNGSLSNIRALLRANVFLVFEDECENIKQNVSLDNVLKLPEGALCLSIIHEFLEFCNLKNTLFVYMAESRQRKEYVYEGQKKLSDKLNLSKKENIQEPILVQLLKQILQSSQNKYFDQTCNMKRDKCDDNVFKDDQNCTYIVHEDSSGSATSNSQSDNSSDEKNKLHLRLSLDNSDTDTSSESTRDKSSSEYIPSEHIHDSRNIIDKNIFLTDTRANDIKQNNRSNIYNMHKNDTNFLRELTLMNNNSSSDSTSYVSLKPYKHLDDKLLGAPISEVNEKEVTDSPSINSDSKSVKVGLAQQSQVESKIDCISSETLSSGSLKNEEEIGVQAKLRKNSMDISEKSEGETAEYSNDFTSSPVTKHKDSPNTLPFTPESIQEEFRTKAHTNSAFETQHHNSQSSQSSVSISDVADLISDKSSFGDHASKDNNTLDRNSKTSIHFKKVSNNDKSKLSDDSAEFSESPIPSLSNLSLDIHSD